MAAFLQNPEDGCIANHQNDKGDDCGEDDLNDADVVRFSLIFALLLDKKKENKQKLITDREESASSSPVSRGANNNAADLFVFPLTQAFTRLIKCSDEIVFS